jgi:hypothetical protein
MLETTEQVHTPAFLDAPVSGTSQADPSQDEGVLTTEIVQLWQVHGDYQKSIKHETEQFRALRNELGKLLHQMKELLARPGRNGQWTAWLKERAIPRSTADRLVKRFERSLYPQANRTSDSISEPTDEEIQKLFFKVLRKLRPVLRTPQSVYRFVDLLTLSCDGAGRRVTDEGLLLIKPLAQSQSDAPQDLAMEPSPGETAIESQMVSAPSMVESDGELM